ncbi:GtrA family protein [Exiguobacterium sp. ZOR0005]|uniref:GtrA family protein n=2 Tax=Bacillales Family XII. Incertae Sedis TaxID=539742 RepID=UPI000462B98A|nr:GtrA family protein [Exiguobacterium sp. ZOR0005]
MNKRKAEFIRFIVIGGINTLNYYLVYMLFHHVWKVGYGVSHVVAFTLSMVASFFLNSYFTFKVKPTLRKFLQFPLTQVVNFTVTTVCIYLLVEQLNVSTSIAPLFAIFIAVPATFIVTSKILKREQSAV